MWKQTLGIGLLNGGAHSQARVSPLILRLLLPFCNNMHII